MSKNLIFGTTRSGNAPGDYWQIEFTELPRKERSKHILVLVDTLTGQSEAFSCRTNKSKEIVQMLWKEIIPRLGIPLGTSSDRGPHFIPDIIKQLSKILAITRDLHAR